MHISSTLLGALAKLVTRLAIALSAIGLLGPVTIAQPATPTASVTSAGHPYSAFQVKVEGRGRAIIMIPGLASSGATWDATVAHLSDHYQCVQLTLAGFAGVPPIDAPLLTTAREQIAQYIRDNDLDQPVIMGHSLGGFIALDLAAHYPKLVGPVIIVDSLPFMAGAWFQADSVEAARPTIEKMRTGMQGMTHEQWEAMTRSGASTNAMATSERDQKTLISWGLASDQGTVTKAMIEMISTDLRPEMNKIESPVLVIGTWVGLKDYGVTEDSATQLFHQQYADVSHLQFVMAKQARHFVMWDDPAWFNTQVDGFLAAKAPPGSSRK